MKMALFLTPNNDPAPSGLKGAVQDLGWVFIPTKNPDEVDQAGKQTSKVLLLFTDAKFAYRFLKDNTWNDFETLRILYLDRRPILNEDVKNKLASVELELFILGEEKQLTDKIKRFENEGSAIMEDIEFSANQDLEK